MRLDPAPAAETVAIMRREGSDDQVVGDNGVDLACHFLLRATFRFEDVVAVDVDYVDYH